MYCSNCGTQATDPQARFCRGCGLPTLVAAPGDDYGVTVAGARAGYDVGGRPGDDTPPRPESLAPPTWPSPVVAPADELRVAHPTTAGPWVTLVLPAVLIALAGLALGYLVVTRLLIG